MLKNLVYTQGTPREGKAGCIGGAIIGIFISMYFMKKYYNGEKTDITKGLFILAGIVIGGYIGKCAEKKVNAYYNKPITI